ncbi:hypothetical protein, partial [Alkalibacterium gilvum]
MKHFKMRRLLSSFLVTTLFLSGCGLFGESDTETDSENAVNSDENLSDESGSDEPSDEATDE